MVTWTENPNHSGARQVGYGQIVSNPPQSRAQNFSEEANAQTFCGTLWQSNMLTGESKAETLCTFNKLASKKPLKNMSRAACDEVNIAVVRVTEMSRAEMLARMGALEKRAE